MIHVKLLSPWPSAFAEVRDILLAKGGAAHRLEVLQLLVDLALDCDKRWPIKFTRETTKGIVEITPREMRLALDRGIEMRPTDGRDEYDENTEVQNEARNEGESPDGRPETA